MKTAAAQRGAPRPWELQGRPCRSLWEASWDRDTPPRDPVPLTSRGGWWHQLPQGLSRLLHSLPGRVEFCLFVV